MMQELPGVERPTPLTHQEHEQLNDLIKRLNGIGEVCEFLILTCFNVKPNKERV